ncbi:gp195 [Sphingomonas phage PAU]|uniref:gp195 n=1 Tax=Sphingomonas phage PAU TaxID=1150991 RepID=UPI0002573361|nr:gp195 [Sphingomonas phage PAU]AFF28193.1 gp195 [Sphingomonas phage PAU]
MANETKTLPVPSLIPDCIIYDYDGRNPELAWTRDLNRSAQFATITTVMGDTSVPWDRIVLVHRLQDQLLNLLKYKLSLMTTWSRGISHSDIIDAINTKKALIRDIGWKLRWDVFNQTKSEIIEIIESLGSMNLEQAIEFRKDK